MNGGMFEVGRSKGSIMIYFRMAKAIKDVKMRKVNNMI